MKYEELINDLRHYSNVSITAAVGEFVSDAAGAIETLQAEVDEWIDRCYRSNEKVAELSEKVAGLQAAQPHWVIVEERKPPEDTYVWCVVYTTDIIYMEDGETPEETIENRLCEAAMNPRITLGSYSEDEGWTDGYFGMPMVCRPDYWLEMTIPEPPKEGTHENSDNP